MAFSGQKCEARLEKEKAEKKELEILFQEYQYAWDCCTKGGNFTDAGYCSYEWQNEVRSLKRNPKETVSV